MRNARFLVRHHSDFVKLTLKPGQSLRWVDSGYTEEGWFAVRVEWWYDAIAGTIVRTIEKDGSDCDGRLETYDVAVVALDQLHSHVAHDGITLLPAWKHTHSTQRDHSAEAMGY